jgi:hypothetical protein
MVIEATESPDLDVALNYARRGWHVLPLHTYDALFGCSCGSHCDSPGKHPLTLHGLEDATTDERDIRFWYARWRGCNIGIRTGAQSGLVVLDVDPRHEGTDSLAELEKKHGPLPVTVEVITGSGGRHFYFSHPGGRVENSAGRFGRGIDIRGDGGFVVAVPSRHESGRRYAWELSSHPDEVPLASAPDWLINPSEPNGAARPATNWREVIANGAVEGERNMRIASLAGHLFAHRIDPFEVLDLVLLWNAGRCRPPLPEEEVTRTVDSIAARQLRTWEGGRGRG